MKAWDRAPVQRGPRGPAGTITWAEHVEAWAAYDRRYHGQTAERIAERGGFGHTELAALLGHAPRTFEAAS